MALNWTMSENGSPVTMPLPNEKFISEEHNIEITLNIPDAPPQGGSMAGGSGGAGRTMKAVGTVWVSNQRVCVASVPLTGLSDVDRSTLSQVVHLRGVAAGTKTLYRVVERTPPSHCLHEVRTTVLLGKLPQPGHFPRAGRWAHAGHQGGGPFQGPRYVRLGGNAVKDKGGSDCQEAGGQSGRA